MSQTMNPSQVIPGLVSVVVCAYNNWPDVEMSVESALHQSYRPIEVVVIDNSSTDSTPEEIPARFGSSVRYIRQPNLGAASQRNAGLGVAGGEFIQFLDGDDVLAPNKIEKQMAVFQMDPEVDIVYGDIRFFQTQSGVAKWQDYAAGPERHMLTWFAEPRKRFPEIDPLGMLFRRRALERVGPWDESQTDILIVEDIDYLLRAAYAGCHFAYCPDSIMGFKRKRPDQKTKNQAATRRAFDLVWENALEYVTREPYRSLVAAKVASRKFDRAIHRIENSRREALALLASARVTSPETVSSLDYVAGYAAILLPGGAALVRSGCLGALRRGANRLFRRRQSFRPKG
jgi:GT2 family glycosyltransferase